MRATANRRVLFGGTTFMSPSFDPSTGRFSVSARETCLTFTAPAPPEGYRAGDRTMGGTLAHGVRSPSTLSLVQYT
jgi:hypothetical protein